MNIKSLKVSAICCATISISALTIAPAIAGTVQDVTLTGVGCSTSTTVCFANVDKNIGTCTNKKQLRWDGGTSAGKSITATMLTAKAGGSLTNIGFNDGVCFSGGTAYPDLNFVTLK